LASIRLLIGQFSGVKQMYAVVETGGKQYRVADGDKLMVEKLNVEEGADIQLDRVLMVCENGKVEVGTPVLDGTSVGAKVLLQGRGEKIKVYKFKRRTKYRKTQGHRQSFTQLEIISIGDAKAAPKAKVETEAKKAAPKKAAPKKEKTAKAAKGEGDKLTDINGIGPVIAQKLNDAGVSTFQQIADFTAEQIFEIDETLNFKGRIEREEWVAQAKKLTS
jgi:large subunit ribosomal protein L21